MLEALTSTLRRVEYVVTAVAALCMFAIMLIVGADVVMRYVFRSPLSWTYDFISLYLMAALFFLVVSDAYASHSHVNVDILYKNMPATARRLCDVITLGVGSALFTAMCYAGALRFWSAFEASDVLAGAIPWPMWPSYVLVPVGAGLMAFRLVLHLVNAIASLVVRRELVPSLTLPAGHTLTGE